MKSKVNFILLITLLVFLSSCELIFGPPQRNKITKYSRPEYSERSVFVYSTANNSMVDSFVVERLTIGYNDEDEHEEILIFLKSPDNTFYRSFGIFLYPDWIGVTFNHYQSIGFSADEPTQNVEINGINYGNVYIVEQETDTLIDKILFQGENGILGYRFVDGDEYYLDTIINPE